MVLNLVEKQAQLCCGKYNIQFIRRSIREDLYNLMLKIQYAAYIENVLKEAADVFVV